MPIYIYQTSAKKSEEFCEALFEEAHQFLCLLDQKNAEGELAVILQPTDDSARSWLLLKRLLSQISTLEDLVLGDDLGANDEDEDEAFDPDDDYAECDGDEDELRLEDTKRRSLH